MEVIKKYKNLFIFHLIINIILAIWITNSAFYHLPLKSIFDYVPYGILMLCIQFCVFGFVYFFSLNKYVFVVTFSVLFLTLSIISYWGYTHEIFLSTGVIQATFESKPDIVLDLISWQLILFFLISILINIAIIRYYWRHKNLQKPNVYLLVLAFISIITFYGVEHIRRGTIISKTPFNLFYTIYSYYKSPEVKYYSPVINVPFKNKDLKVIFVLGESVRADHLSLNEYPRITTPLLQKQANLINYPKAYTSHTYTSASVPQILSDLSVYEEKNELQISLIEVLNAANITTYWLGNQTPERSYYPFIEKSTIIEFADPTQSDISFRKKMDGALIPIFDKYIQERGPQFMTLHMIGSHWWYESRYPDSFRLFTPTIKSKYIPENDSMSMINSYDNTIVYMDFVVNTMIETLKTRNENAILIYISDHGEQLGEEGKWLHATLNDKNSSVSNPAVFLWYSDIFKQRFPNYVSAMKTKTHNILPLDFFYHTVLDLFQIDNITIIDSLSIIK